MHCFRISQLHFITNVSVGVSLFLSECKGNLPCGSECAYLEVFAELQRPDNFGRTVLGVHCEAWSFLWAAKETIRSGFLLLLLRWLWWRLWSLFFFFCFWIDHNHYNHAVGCLCVKINHTLLTKNPLYSICWGSIAPTITYPVFSDIHSSTKLGSVQYRFKESSNFSPRPPPPQRATATTTTFSNHYYIIYWCLQCWFPCWLLVLVYCI